MIAPPLGISVTAFGAWLHPQPGPVSFLATVYATIPIHGTKTDILSGLQKGLKSSLIDLHVGTGKMPAEGQGSLIRGGLATVWHETRMQADGRDGRGTGRGTSVITRTRPKTKKPSLYRVLILNDDYTPMEFVIHILERFFQKDRETATRIMLHVHNHGVGECGVYTFEVAETKVAQVMDFSRQNQHPLQCVMEKK